MLNRHRLRQLTADAFIVALAWWLAFQLRFDNGLPVYYKTLLERTVLLVIAIKLVVFALSGFYTRWWRYVSTRDMWRAVLGVLAACIVAVSAVYLLAPVHNVRLPRSIAALDLLLTLAFITGSRLLARTLIERPGRGVVARGPEVLVVGAGDAGQQVVKEMQRSRLIRYTPIGYVDDDPNKRNDRFQGVRVLGTIADLPRIVGENKPDEILIAIPSASGEVRQRVVELARDAKVPVKTLPGLYELISGQVEIGQIRPVQVEDVLGREQVEVDFESVAAYLVGKTVLVTGAGGSIGSELCRQIARIGPARLVLLDQAETPLYEIERELVNERGFTPSIPVLADVKDRAALGQIFERYRPEVVFHAAAYKHVHLMEANPLESLRTNVLGTQKLADVAVEFGAERFVLISTDKAANPKSVYGQCKALCEWVVEALGHRPDVTTRFVAVRFGNVLGSAGSVVPLFRRQIESGGPVTVTHPEMTRFFMTIPEAVSLVVQAGAIGGRGEIFILDMGNAVKIVDLARNMIRLSGKEPDTDVQIEYVGVRAGEKLHEELWTEEEHVTETRHPKILRSRRPPVDAGWVEHELATLQRLADAGDTLEVVSRLAAITREQRRETAREPQLEDTLH